jgi:hypothetical protein
MKRVDLAKLTDDDIAKLTCNVSMVLSDIAFDALRAGVAVFPGELIGKHLQAAHPSIENLLQTGILVQTRAVSSADWQQSQYYFMHLTLMEYFAGKAVAKLLSLPSHKAALRRDDLAWLFAHKDAPMLALAWQFTASELARLSPRPPPQAPTEPRPIRVSSNCSICHTKFGLFTSRYHCVMCGLSVCDSHSHWDVDNRRLCADCVHPAANAAGLLETWWGDALTSTWFHTPEDSQIQLWLRFGEDASVLQTFHRGFRDILAVVVQLVRADVLLMFRGKLGCARVKWWATLRDCPNMCKLILFDWDEFNLYIASGPVTADLARLPYELADVLVDSPALIAFLLRVWESTVLTPDHKVCIVDTIASCPALTLADVIVGEAVRASVTALQDAAAACLRHKLYLLSDSAFLEACTDAYITSTRLLSELQRLCGDHWVPVLAGRELCVSGSLSLQGRYLSKIQAAGNVHSPGLAVSRDGMRIAISNCAEHTVTIYELGTGHAADSEDTFPVIRTIGGHGSDLGKFNAPEKLCFTVAGSVLVAEWEGKRVQEVTASGDHVMFVGLDTPGGLGYVAGLDCNQHVVAICHQHGVDGIPPPHFNQIVLCDYATGGYLRSFGGYGSIPGCLNQCWGLRISRDGRHVFVAEALNHRVSIFTAHGVHVRSFGSSSELNGPSDVCVTDNGEVVVAGNWNHNVVVYTPDGSKVSRTFGKQGTSNGEFLHSTAVSYVCGKLYVLDLKTARVQVFE